MNKRIMCVRRHDLERVPERIRLEIPRRNEKSLLLSSHYFSPFILPAALANYFNFLSDGLNGYQYPIIIQGDFNAAKVNWSTREFGARIAFYAKKKAQLIFNLIDLLGLDIVNTTCDDGSSTLDLIMTNCDLQVLDDVKSLVHPDCFYLPFSITLHDQQYINLEGGNLPAFNFPRGEYARLYQEVSEVDWCGVLLRTEVGDAAAALQDKLLTAMNRCIPKFGPRRSSQFPVWFSADFIRCLKSKKKAHSQYKRTGLREAYEVFASLRTHIKSLLQHDRQLHAQKCEDLSA